MTAEDWAFCEAGHRPDPGSLAARLVPELTSRGLETTKELPLPVILSALRFDVPPGDLTELEEESMRTALGIEPRGQEDRN